MGGNVQHFSDYRRRRLTASPMGLARGSLSIRAIEAADRQIVKNRQRHRANLSHRRIAISRLSTLGMVVVSGLKTAVTSPSTASFEQVPIPPPTSPPWNTRSDRRSAWMTRWTIHRDSPLISTMSPCCGGAFRRSTRTVDPTGRVGSMLRPSIVTTGGASDASLEHSTGKW